MVACASIFASPEVGEDIVDSIEVCVYICIYVYSMLCLHRAYNLLRYERKDRFFRLAIVGLIELSSLSVVFYHHIYT
jgi:hypothetical protein